MRKLSLLVLVVLGAIGCGGGSSSPESRLVGEWIVFDSTSTNAVGLTFNSDGTYAAQQLELTSSTSANDEGEGGVYTATTSAITFTPQKSSCPGPDPVYTFSYSFNAASLVISAPSGVISFERNPYANSGASGTLTFGCFQADGSFVPEPIAPVGN